jgi:hypothetical protein
VKKKPDTRDAISLRPSAEILASLDALLEKYPLLNRHTLACAAVELGISVMEKDPKWIEKVGKK